MSATDSWPSKSLGVKNDRRLTGYSHTISAEQLLPVLLSLPHTDESPRLPFLFTGGFALSTKSIGSLLSLQGIVQTFATLLIFPLVNSRLGSLTTFRMSVLSYPLLYLLVPYLTVLPEPLRMPGMYVAIVWKVTAQAFAFPPMQILLANSAPSKRILGTLNGTAASSASLCRAIGPTVSGLIQSLGLSVGCLGLPWWSGSLVACIGAMLSLFLVEENRRHLRGRHGQNQRDQEYPYADVSDAESMPVMVADADVEPLAIADR